MENFAYHNWITLIASFVVCMVCFTPSVWFAFLFVELQKDLNATAVQTGWLGSLMLSSSLALSPFSAVLGVHLGVKGVAVLGSFLCSVSFYASSYAPNMEVLLLTFGVAYGLASCILLHCSIRMFYNLFGEKNGLRALSLISLGPYVGAVAGNGTIQKLFAVCGWRLTLRFMAAAMAGVAPLAFCFYRGSSSAKNNSVSIFQETEDSKDAEQTQTGNISVIRFHSNQSFEPDEEQKVSDEPDCKVTTVNENDQTEESVIRFHRNQSFEPDGPDEEQKVSDEPDCKVTTGNENNQTEERVIRFHRNQSFEPDEEQKVSDEPECKVTTVNENNQTEGRTPRMSEDIKRFLNRLIRGFWRWATSSFSQLFPFTKLTSRNNFFDLQVSFLQDIEGMSDNQLWLVLTVLNVADILARSSFVIFGGTFCGQTPYVTIFTVLLMVALSSLFVFVTSLGPLLVMAFAVGWCRSNIVVLSFSMSVDLLGSEYADLIVTLVMYCQGVGYLLGSPTIGFIYDATGSYDMAFVLVSIYYLLAAGILISLAIRSSRRVKTRRLKARFILAEKQPRVSLISFNLNNATNA
ncbi:hypothetical protein BSL78_21917 [Apostichopus japonicus]|uniref:Uncharacterized protein n=1 Tax=Stichopus japonicus TaxID=307972 RepID=A0A2G8JZP5_STIJA|nr:hypothetical protein BSL78_21917 [Apostichopus japonicus]